MARLVAHVHVVDKNNVVHVFGPDDDVPVWAKKQITNDAVWDEPPTTSAPAKTAAEKAAEKKAAAEKAAADKEAAEKAAAEKEAADKAAAEEAAATADQGATSGSTKPAPGEAFKADTADQ